MPFAENWVEELVAEWLRLEGYLVEVGLPVSVARRGGRYEADIVGARIRNNVLEIIHIECGQLSGGKQSINSLQKKFSLRNCNQIKNYFRNRLEFTGTNVKYHKMYVASYWSRPAMQEAMRLGIKVRPLPDFIRKEVLSTIKKWKDKPYHKPRTKGGHITLPKTCWLLQLIDYLCNKGLLK